MELASEAHTWDLEAVKQMLDEGWGDAIRPPSLEVHDVPGLTDLCLEEADLSKYNILLN